MNQTRLSLVEHLTDLRQAIVTALSAFLTASAIGYYFAPLIFATLKQALPAVSIVYFGPFDGFYLQLRVAIITGLVIASPVIAASIVWFIAPGLYAQEKKALMAAGVAALSLFTLGVAYALTLLLPKVLNFLLAYATAEMMPFIAGEDYLSFVMSFLVYTGLAFNIPLLLFLLLKYNLLSPGIVTGQRKICLGLLTGLTLFFAPGGDLVTQGLLALPVYLLFECAVFVAGLVKKYSCHFGGDRC